MLENTIFNDYFCCNFQRTFEMADYEGARDQHAPIIYLLWKSWPHNTTCKSHETSHKWEQFSPEAKGKICKIECIQNSRKMASKKTEEAK